MRITYFIADEHARVKIGVTTGLPGGNKPGGRASSMQAYRRLKELQTANADTLTILCVLQGDWEQILHGCFGADYIRGEWFHLSSRIKTFINGGAGFVKPTSAAEEYDLRRKLGED